MSDSPTEPSLPAFALPTSVCPRCERDDVRNGICPFCGPLTERAPASTLDDEWEELTVSRRRAELTRARNMAGQAASFRRDRTRGLVVGAVVSVAVVAGLVAWWSRGDLAAVQQTVRQSLPALPARSAGAAELARFARELHELASESEGRLLKGRPSAQVAGRLRAQLKQLQKGERALEPKLTRDESQILIVLGQAERSLEQFLRSFEGKIPDTQGAGVKAAHEQIAKAQAMLRGEAVDGLVDGAARKVGQAAKRLGEKLDPQR